jgi:hypothetical protein
MSTFHFVAGVIVVGSIGVLVAAAVTLYLSPPSNLRERCRRACERDGRGRP